MGAGSAKGLRKSASEGDADNVSVNSDGQWNDQEGGRARVVRPGTGNVSDKHRRSKSSDFPRANTGKSALRVVPDSEEPPPQQQPKREAKKTSFFSFNRHKNEDDDSEHDSEANERKDSTTTGRFKIFGRKKEPPKDEKLDTEIDDIEKTFDSLGIIGKTAMFADGKDITPSRRSKDDLDALEPMRNKANVRTTRPMRGLNGVAGGVDIYGKSDQLSSTSSSRRKFQFSWDNDDDDKKSSQPVDEWNYQTVQIEGFDINKFKEANVHNTIDMNGSSAPSALRNPGPDDPYASLAGRGRSPSPLQYDADDQQILASIERALSE